MTEKDACDAGEEDLVGGEKGDEDAGGTEKVPGVDGEREDCADEEAFANSQVFGEEGGYVVSGSLRIRLVCELKYQVSHDLPDLRKRVLKY